MTPARWTLGTFLAALAIIAATLAAGNHPRQPPARVPDSTAAMRADLAAFRSEFLARDRSYSPAARKDAEAELAAIESALDRTTPVGFELALVRVVALADNGHTMAFAAPRAARFNRVAIRLTPFGGDFHVLSAERASADLNGARLVAIDGHPLAELRDAARTLAGGLPAWRDRFAGFLFESPEQLHALGLAAKPDAATYRFEALDGRTVERALAARPAGDDSPAGGSDRWLYPELTAAEEGRWTTLLPAASAPWWLRERGVPFRSRSLPDEQTLVIQLRQVHDAPERPIRDFEREMIERIEAGHPRHLVVDMRLNGGGDLTTARDFMQRLPALVPGRIFVLTNGWTFSAAISSVGYLKQAAPGRVTIAGEEVGDRLEFFAEGRPVFLPNSGIGLLPATERHDYRTGCRGFDDCHPPMVRYPIGVPTLAPELPVPLTIDAYRTGTDPVMEQVVAAIRAAPR